MREEVRDEKNERDINSIAKSHHLRSDESWMSEWKRLDTKEKSERN